MDANLDNWSFLHKETNRKRINQLTRRTGKIPNLVIECRSPILRVKIDSNQAIPTWFLGGWATLLCLANGDYARIPNIKPCGLAQWTLLEFGAPTKSLPYKLEITFPYWLPEVDIEVQQFIEPSGLYVGGELAGLQKTIQGEDFFLENPVYQEVNGQPGLITSKFELKLVWQKYEVGRFINIASGQPLMEPKIDLQPYRLQVEFTSDQRIGSKSVSVNIRPKT